MSPESTYTWGFMKFLTSALLFISLGTSVLASENGPTFQDGQLKETNTGYTQLTWGIPSLDSTKSPAEYELQRAKNQSFDDAQTIYRGPNHSIFISGLNDGQYYYRVRRLNTSLTENWSETLELKVSHQSLTTSLVLFFLGLLSFMAIVFTIIKGHKQSEARSA